MTPERWRKIDDIFQSALDLEGQEREAFVRCECLGDENLRAEVQKLIDRFEKEESFLESPVWTDSRFLGQTFKNKVAESLEEDLGAGFSVKSFIDRRIGVYKLTEEIGKGGMGIVYAAERADGEFSQKVAVKLIKRGMDTDFIVRRFRHERQILAALNHSNIARLLDGGTTEDDESPYFVMEFIEGEPFFKYCESTGLDLPKKIELFLQICAAVSYAHKRKIVHRDIKPSNILVTKEGEVKLLDFGIAKILDPDLIHESIMPTGTQMRLMTPEYASPEQVRGEKITEASDQYSLGVMLYELITGDRPYKFPSRAPHEIARVICEEIPSEPSSGNYGTTLTDDDSFSAIDEMCRKLDSIVLKTLRKEPTDRYDSVAEFVADLERFLRNEKIQAESSTPISSEIEFPAVVKQNSIAILPFKIINTETNGDRGGSEFFGIGLADALISRLSGVKRLILRPTSSVMRFAAGHFDSFAAGNELNTEFVLEGSVFLAGEKIRVTVQLLEVETKSTVWAERIMENSTDILNLEDIISAKVAESLLPQLTKGEISNLEKRATDNGEAYENYLKGRFHWNTFTEDGFRQAIIFYKKAVELDPNYALALAGIADYFMWLGIYGVLPPKDSYQPAKKSAQRAIQIDDKLAEGYAALGFARLCADYDWTTSEKNILRAIEINPNYAVAHNWLAILYFTGACFEEGIRHAKKAVALDPLTYQNYRTLYWGYYFSRQFEKAAIEIDRAIEMFPLFGVAYFNRSWLWRAMGNTAESLKSSERAVELANNSGFVLLGHAQALAAAGKLDEAEKVIERVREKSASGYVSDYQLALVYCYAGKKASALDTLERAYERRDGWLVWLNVEPALDILRGEPRFVELVNKIKPDFASQEKTDNIPDTTLLLEKKDSTGEKKTAKAVVSSSKRKLYQPILKFIAVFLIVTSAIFLINRLTRSFISHIKYNPTDGMTETGEKSAKLFGGSTSIRRLTDTGNITAAAISPDGKTIVYAAGEKDRQGLWLRETEANRLRRILPDEAVTYQSLTFSPDGSNLFYSTAKSGYGGGALYRLPVGGGEPQQILNQITRKIDISPDEKQAAYFNYDSAEQKTVLNVADFNGDGKLAPPSALISHPKSDDFEANPAFSPDGKKLAYAGSAADGYQSKLFLFVTELDRKTEEKIEIPNFFHVSTIAWRSDGASLIFNASETDNLPSQLWEISYPSGQTNRLSHDLSSYFGANLTADRQTLLAVKRETVSNIWLAGLDGKFIGGGDDKPLTSGNERLDGTKGVRWTAENSILYIAGSSGKNIIAEIDANGANKHSFSFDDLTPVNPILSGDGKFLFFGNEQESGKIKRLEIATSKITEITSDQSLFPTLSPDGRYLIYSAFDAADNLTVRRLSVNGGSPTQIINDSCARPAISPNGRLIACYYKNAATGNRWEIAIFNFDGGAPVKILKPADTVNLQTPFERPLGWSADSRSIFYLNDKNGISNVFSLDINGNNPPVPMTHFTSGRIFDFAVSPNSKQVALARGTISSDIVIFQNTAAQE